MGLPGLKPRGLLSSGATHVQVNEFFPGCAATVKNVPHSQICNDVTHTSCYRAEVSWAATCDALWRNEKSLAAFHKEGRHLLIVTGNTVRGICVPKAAIQLICPCIWPHSTTLYSSNAVCALSSISASTSTAGKIKQLANVILLIWVLL